MDKTNSIILWGERGLVCSMFIDFSRVTEGKGWEKFLQVFSFTTPFWKEGTIKSALIIVEPDFSNEGFGHPDAIARFELDDGQSVVVILEAKRLPYSKSCISPTQRGGAGYNSKLNGQLELNHCLALALSSFEADKNILCEPEWILHTPYTSERRGKLRSLKNQVVIENVAKPFSGLPFRNYYHCVITTDPANPFDDTESLPLLPELYYPDYPFQNCWKQLRTQYAWASWDKIEVAINELKSSNGLRDYSLFIPTIELNRRNFKSGTGASDDAIESPEDELCTQERENIKSTKRVILPNRGSRGASMIFAPSINPKTFLHFSWLNESTAIRDYSQGPNIMPFEDRSKKTSEVLSKIEKEILVRNRQPISDTKYWNEITLKLNESLDRKESGSSI